ncbi:MAG: hypothetical protein V4662_10010 [Verrucomicrobiota bacterium]
MILGLVLGGLVGAAALYVTQVDPGLLARLKAAISPGSTPAQSGSPTSPETPEQPTSEEQPQPIVHQGLPQTPFEMGALHADEPVETIKITLGAGMKGESLSEPVDVHLGLGFPLRLHPLGGSEHDAAFAACPQKSSLVDGATDIQPGQMASFEFTARGDDPGLDTLHTSQQLLTGLKCGDLQRIGFASQGRTDWTLAGYRIEVNGKLFAANGVVDARPQEKLASSRDKLMKLLPEYEAHAAKPSPSDSEKAALRAESELVRSLSGRVTGAFPWWEESSPSFKPAPITGTLVQNVHVTLQTGAGAQPGTRHPIYLLAGARKFLLSSELSPLQDASGPQTYELASFELAINPLTRESLAQPGIGILGSGAAAQRVPDRAQLQRVAIEADAQPVYDSDKNAGDAQVLSSVWLTPSAHLDENGEIVRTPPTANERSVWLAGTPSASVPEKLPPLPPEPPLPPVIIEPPPPLWPPVRIFIPDGYPPPPGGGGFLSLLDILAALLFPLPPPVEPLISGVRIDPATTIVRDGDAVTVDWTVSGGTELIAAWRIDLFGVLPHKPVPVFATPLASIPLTPSGPIPPGVDTHVSRITPTIVRANIAAMLTGAEALYLYVQPRVTALDTFGNVITAANGSLLPLFPSGTTVASVGTRRGGVLKPFPPGNASAPSFQVTPPLPALPLPWKGMPLADPLAIRNAWSLVAEHGSHFGLLFASHENIPAAIHLPSWSTAIRPTGDGAEVITIRFEGLVPIPAAANGLRAVAHVGFVGGSSPATTAEIDARAELSSGPTRRNMAGNLVPFPFGAQPFFRLHTAVNPLPADKASPLLLIDMPLRFDRMTAVNFANYPVDPIHGADFVAGPPAGWMAADFAFNGPAFVAQAGTGTMYVTLTYKIRLTTTDATDAVGVIGVRLVPDNTP